MEIRNDSAGNGGSLRIDLTKANRDAIREQAASLPKPEAPAAAGDVSNDAKRVKAARAEASVLKRVKDARSDFSVHKRVQLARKEYAANGPEDHVTLSTNAQQLADLARTPRESDLQARAQRVSELKAQHQSGKLDVQGLVAETAYRMLSGD